MKSLLAVLCAIIPAFAACATDPDPSVPTGSTQAAVAGEDGPCLHYCTGGRAGLVCVPVCRKELRVVFDLQPIPLTPPPVCGDGVCRLPEEWDRDSPFYCRKDCWRPIAVTKDYFMVDGKTVATASEQGVLLEPSAFDLEW